MKKKFKLFTTLFSFCFTLAVLCVGVYAATSVDYTVNGTVSYEVEDAFVEVTTTLYSDAQQYDLADLAYKVEDIAKGNVQNLTLVQTSDTYSSTETEGNSFTPTNELKFSTQSGGALTYFYVVNIKNLGDNNVWAVVDDNVTLPNNVINYEHAVELNIAKTDDQGKNIVLSITIEDTKTAITRVENNFSAKIKIGSGRLAEQDFNLAKFNQTELASGKLAKASNDISGVLVIPADKTFVSNAFQNCNISTLIFEEGFGNIGAFGFTNCKFLKTVIFASTTDDKGSATFSGCSKLVYIDLKQATSLQSNAFYNCTSLKRIEIPGTVTNIVDAFQNCSKLEYIYFKHKTGAEIKISSYNFGTGTAYFEEGYTWTSNKDANGNTVEEVSYTGSTLAINLRGRTWTITQTA